MLIRLGSSRIITHVFFEVLGLILGLRKRSHNITVFLLPAGTDDSKKVAGDYWILKAVEKSQYSI